MTREDADNLHRIIQKFGDMTPGQLINQLVASTGSDSHKIRDGLRRRTRGQLLADAVWNATCGFERITSFPVRKF
jgi:hypothetical protein